MPPGRPSSVMWEFPVPIAQLQHWPTGTPCLHCHSRTSLLQPENRPRQARTGRTSAALGVVPAVARSWLDTCDEYCGESGASGAAPCGVRISLASSWTDRDTRCPKAARRQDYFPPKSDGAAMLHCPAFASQQDRRCDEHPDGPSIDPTIRPVLGNATCIGWGGDNVAPEHDREGSHSQAERQVHPPLSRRRRPARQRSFGSALYQQLTAGVLATLDLDGARQTRLMEKTGWRALCPDTTQALPYAEQRACTEIRNKMRSQATHPTASE